MVRITEQGQQAVGIIQVVGTTLITYSTPQILAHKNLQSVHALALFTPTCPHRLPWACWHTLEDQVTCNVSSPPIPGSPRNNKQEATSPILQPRLN